MRKDVKKLTEDDFAAHPLWRYVNDDALGDTVVESVDDWPLADLDGLVIGSTVTISCGKTFPAIFSNVSVVDAEWNGHVLSLSILDHGQMFHLARYHDIVYARRGPQALAEFLNLSIDEIFPMKYDLCKFVIAANPAVLASEILLEPKVRLSRREIIHRAASGE